MVYYKFSSAFISSHFELPGALRLIKSEAVALMMTMFPAERYEELYCFSYQPNADEDVRRQEWGFFDFKADYSRMGLPNAQWKLSPINKNYKVSRLTSVE